MSSNNGGATNWPPQAFSPDTGLLYVPTAENYAMYYLTELDPRGAMGLGGKDEVGVGGVGSYITAIDYKTGKTVWRHNFRTAVGDGRGGPGLLTTAGRLLFGGDVSGNFVAFDPANGTPLWHHALGGNVSNAPQTYLVGGQAARARRGGRHAVRVCVAALAQAEGSMYITTRIRPVDARESGAAGAVPRADDRAACGSACRPTRFRELPRARAATVEPLIKAMKEIGLTECELWAPQIEPAQPRRPRHAPPEDVQKAREALARWRVETPLDHFRAIRKKFDAAGIAIYAFNYSPDASFTDEEIDRGFEIAKALGAEIITASTTLAVAKRIVPFAEKHRMVVAMHNHSSTDDPNEFATPESFAAAMKLSKYFKINLDIGHFTAANYDAVAYLREHHANITNLHIKDRKKNQGDNVPWGTGDTPIREVLQLLKREKWPIRAYVEYEYRGTAGAGRGSEDLLRLREAGARMTRGRIGMGLGGPRLRRRASHRRGPAARLRRRRRGGGEHRGVGAAQGRCARRAEGLRQLRSARRDPDVHVVHNTTPNYLHAPVIMAALAHRKHVVSDKPLAMTAAEARRLLARRRAAPASCTPSPSTIAATRWCSRRAR